MIDSQTKDERLDAIYAEAEQLDRAASWTQKDFNRLFKEFTELTPGEDPEPFLVLVPAEYSDQWSRQVFGHPGKPMNI